jgi:hypothetical protein
MRRRNKAANPPFHILILISVDKIYLTMYPYSKEVRIMLAKKTTKNQLTLPKEIVKAFPDTDYFDVSVRGKKIVLVPVRITPVVSTLEAVRNKIEKLGITEQDISDAVKWARKRK